ncbi:hypothetical protein DBR12_06255 [Acidovorax sp. HMWF029]|uniref:hypothetical protein n=1 Tax=Acidovorax sp. HMWF029 TaxID=2056863 RepID=UPI000D364169|nr:hypothetical protein [Acidovorax sp. HMWF029]PTT21669.1 hypothetical protein DBR12_06255 [Acidovorax sp. HMWF029]
MGMLVPGNGNSCAALQDTSMGTVPGTTPGAGALAPAPEVTTFDRENLKTLLFMERQDADAVDCLRKIYKRSKSSNALSWALSALIISWEDRVILIRRRGGLLHIGAGV